MQVISSQLKQTVRSTSFSRNNKKGLSLTSGTKYNSLPKTSHQFSSQETFESDHQPSNLTQTSIKLHIENNQHRDSFFQAPSGRSTITENSTIEKPKITFRYSNDFRHGNQNIQRPNAFQQKVQNNFTLQSNRGRILAPHELRRIVVEKSLETKKESRVINDGSSGLRQSSMNRVLIDSRRVQRQIVQEEVYQSYTLIRPALDQNMTNLLQVPHKVRCEQKHEQQKPMPLVEYSSSPYHLLVSTAKRCESRELSPNPLCDHEKNETSGIKIPQIQQFSIRSIVEQENQQDSAYGSRVVFENNQEDKKQQACQGLERVLVGRQAQVKSSLLDLKPIYYLQESRSQHQVVHQKLVNKSPQKIVLLAKVQKSPKKVLKDKPMSKILSDIENMPPENHTNSFLSGRRNIKRFKEIEKRLQEIITICGRNL